MSIGVLHKPFFLRLRITGINHESLKHRVQDYIKTLVHCTEQLHNLSLLDL